MNFVELALPVAEALIVCVSNRDRYGSYSCRSLCLTLFSNYQSAIDSIWDTGCSWLTAGIISDHLSHTAPRLSAQQCARFYLHSVSYAAFSFTCWNWSIDYNMHTLLSARNYFEFSDVGRYIWH